MKKILTVLLCLAMVTCIGLAFSGLRSSEIRAYSQGRPETDLQDDSVAGSGDEYAYSTRGVGRGNYSSGIRRDIDLDIQIVNNAAVLNYEKKIDIDLSFTECELGQLLSVHADGNFIEGAVLNGYTLTIDAYRFGFSYGEKILYVNSGTGSESRTTLLPIRLISKTLRTAEDLDNWPIIASACGLPGRWGGYFRLANDIEYNGDYYVGARWGTLGGGWDDGTTNGFAGVFDGEGHVIKGLAIRNNWSGFVPLLHTWGEIKNIGFTDAVMPAYGGYVCSGGRGKIEKVFVRYSSFGSSWTTGTFYASDRADDNVGITVKDCLVDASDATISGSLIRTYIIGGNDRATYGSLQGVYAVVPAAYVDTAAGSGTAGESVYGAYTTEEDMLSDGSVTAEISSWARPWRTYEGRPYFGTLYPSLKIVENGVSNYKFYTKPGPGSTYRYNAKDHIREHVLAATGATIESRNDMNGWNTGHKVIVIGDFDAFAQAGLTMPEGATYCVMSKDNTIFIMALENTDYYLAAVKFLRETIGYEMFSKDLVVYEKAGPDAYFDCSEFAAAPTFRYRVPGNKLDGKERIGMGYSANDGITGKGSQWHNTFNYLPPSVYKATHPKWYSSGTGGTLTDGSPAQLCYTAHGDNAEREIMITEAAKAVVEFAKDKLNNYSTISFTVQDNHGYCQCPTCRNQNPSIPVVNFVNDLAVKVNEDEELNGRTVKIAFFAYQAYESAPVQNNVLTECGPNVAVIIAPIHAKYTSPINNNTVNGSVKENIEKWKQCCDSIYFWLYNTNFSCYLIPYDTWTTVIDSYRFCVEQGGEFMFNEGQYNARPVTAFEQLKTYIDSHALVDINNADYEKLTSRFFDNYYGSAGRIMHRFYNEVRLHLQDIADKYDIVWEGGCYERLLDADILDQAKRYWPEATLNRWIGYIDSAYAKLDASLAAGEITESEYDVFVKHVKIESIFPRHARIAIYYNKTSYLYELFHPNVMKMRRKFYNDCQELGITNFSENKTLSEKWKWFKP